MKPTALQAATPFLTNVMLILVMWAISFWVRDHVDSLYSERFSERRLGTNSYTRPVMLADLASWAIDLGTLFSTAAVTAASSAVMLQESVDLSAVVYVDFGATLVLFAIAISRIPPYGYSYTTKNRDKKNRWLRIPYPLWTMLMVLVPNAGFAAYAFAHYN